MRRSAKVFLAVILTSALGVASPAALGQPSTPTGAPSAKTKAADGPKDKDKGKGEKATADAGAAPAGDNGLPSGHPPVDPGLPSGHPPIDDGAGDEGDDDEAPPPNPHGGNPHGAAAPRDPRIFQAPPDGSQDDAALPVGTIVVSVRDAQDKPIPHAPLTLGILHSSVAKGDSTERRTAETDSEGNARFDGLDVGSGTTYRFTTTRASATYAIPPFPLNDRAGKRAVLHSYDVSSEIEELPVGAQALVYLSLREDSIQIEHLFSIFNLGPVSWIADTTLSLPDGFKAFNKQEGMSDAHVDEVKGKGAALRGTFSPGRHDLNFRYQVPLDNETRQTVRIELPPHLAQARVVAESSKTMGLEVKGFPDPQKSQREGKRLLITERQMPRGQGGATTLEITLTGLPTPGPGRWIAVALAVFSLCAGFVYYQQKRDIGALDTDVRGDLLEAREALLSEIVALERAHKSGEIGPKTYSRLRASLLDALARIVGMLDAAKVEKKRRREGRTAEPVT